jgi:hypothetical protein
LEAHILRSEGRDNFKFCFWQFLVNLNKCAKFYLNLSRCLPTLQKNGWVQMDLPYNEEGLNLYIEKCLFLWLFFGTVPYHTGIRQCFGSGFMNSGSSILGRIQGFDDQILKKITAEKNWIFFWSEIAIYLSLGLFKRRPSYRRSLFSQKENIQHS